MTAEQVKAMQAENETLKKENGELKGQLESKKEGPKKDSNVTTVHDVINHRKAEAEKAAKGKSKGKPKPKDEDEKKA